MPALKLEQKWMTDPEQSLWKNISPALEWELQVSIS
jgi:hypothetical protein